MVRNIDKYKSWENNRKNMQFEDFERKKQKAFDIANECEDPKGKETLLAVAEKMEFIYEKGIIQYGNCTKFDKEVSFIPNTCQLETQQCFEHRRN